MNHPQTVKTSKNSSEIQTPSLKRAKEREERSEAIAGILNKVKTTTDNALRYELSGDLQRLLSEDNKKHGRFEIEFKKWLSEHLAKTRKTEQGEGPEKPIRDKKKILKDLERIYRHFVVHGKKGQNGELFAATDLDAQASLRIIQECGLFGLSQESLPSKVLFADHSADPTDQLPVGNGVVFLDVGGAAGLDVIVKNNSQGSPMKNLLGSRVVLDHHPVGPTSTTRIVFQLLKALQAVPSEKIQHMERFVRFIDMIDSLGYQVVGADYDHAHETLAGLHKLLPLNFIYNYFRAPGTTGLEIFTEQQKNIPIKSKIKKGVKEPISLGDICSKRKGYIDRSIVEFQQLDKENKYLHLFGTPMVLDVGGKLTNAMEVTSYQKCGIIRIFESGDMYIYSPKYLRPDLKKYGLLVRSNILIIHDGEKQKEFINTNLRGSYHLKTLLLEKSVKPGLKNN